MRTPAQAKQPHYHQSCHSQAGHNQAGHKKTRYLPTLAFSVIAWGSLLALLTVLSVGIGTATISPATTWQALVNFDASNSDHLLVQHLRLPRTLMALLTGAALACAGVIMQALTRNPLADPGILGVNAGAAVAIVLGIALLSVNDLIGQLVLGMIGAGLTGALVLVLGGRRLGSDPVRIVLAGTALSMVLLAVTQIITINSHDQVFEQFRHWAVGTLQGRGYRVLIPALLPILLGLISALMLARSLDTLVLGDDLSLALGSRPRLIWWLSAAVVTLLAGTATAAAGPIAFIGLTAPHLARFIVGPNHYRLLPCAMFCGALLMLTADILGRQIAHPGEVAVGIMIALLGGPFFVVLARRRSLNQP